MYCGNCGFPLSDDAVFCTRCGTRLHAAQNEQPNNEATAPVEQVTPVEQSTTVEQETLVEQPAPAEPEAAPVQSAETPVQPAVTPAENPTEQTNEPTAAQPDIPTKKPAEKEFFGKGAFAFCLVIIALLAIACGIFAGLYFSSGSNVKTGIVTRDSIVRDYFDDNYEGGFIEW